MAVTRKARTKGKAAPKAKATPAAPKGDAKPPAAATKPEAANVLRPFPVRAKGDSEILIVTACSQDGKTYTAHKRGKPEGERVTVASSDCSRV